MADNNQKPPVDEVQLQLSELKASIEQQNKVIADQQKTIAALQTKEPAAVEVKAKKKPETPKDAVEHDGKKYKFTVPHFRIAGSDEVITSEDAATDKTIIAQILKKPGQGILKEQF